MPAPAPNQASFFFEWLGHPDHFEVLQFSGTEAISSLYSFEILLASEDAEIDLQGVLNGLCSLRVLRDTDEVEYSGIVVEIEQLGQNPDRTVYRAVLKPMLWVLTQNTHSRVFQNLSVVDIVKKVLGGVVSNARFDLKESYAPRPYCVQYRETDFDFMSRLLEFEGIAYYFERNGGKETVVFTDYQSYEPIPGEDTVVYDPEGSQRMEEEAVSSLSYRKRTVPNKVILKDYNYESPNQELRAEAGESGHTFYDYGQHFGDLSTGQRLAQVRIEEIQSQHEIISGTSDCAGFQTGHTFALEEHYREDLNREYLLTEVRHEGRQGHATGLGMGYALSRSLKEDPEGTTTYRNEFVSIPATVPFRPIRTTPLPEVPGVLTARIESAGGDNYAYIDEAGRYHVKMPFDLESTTKGSSSKPLRLTQPHAGPDHGMHFPNHDQVEMIWACVNGDVDRPIALGVVPNDITKSPARSPNRMQNVLRTFSGNQMVMDDTVDKATVQVNTPDENTVLLDDAEDRIHIVTTKKHSATLDDKNKRIQLKTTNGHVVTMQDDKKEKKGHVLVQSEAGHIVRLQDDGEKEGHVLVQTKQGHVITINDKDEHITLQDKDEANRIIIDIKNDNITLETKKGGIDLKAPQGKVSIECTDFKLKAKSNAKVDAKQNVEVKAGMKYRQAAMNVESAAQMKHDIKGMQVKSQAQMANDVGGMMVSVKASGINTIQGSLVKIN